MRAGNAPRGRSAVGGLAFVPSAMIMLSVLLTDI